MVSQTSLQPKRSYLRAWLILITAIALTAGVICRRGIRPPPPEAGAEPVGYAFIMVFIGGIFIALGVSSYLVVLFTRGFTFDFNRPVWNAVKKRMFLANIVVPLLFGIGVAVALGGVLNPWLAASGGSVTVPLVGTIIVVQFSQVFILIWSPLEKAIITGRMTALGITPEQMSGGSYIGISNPAVTSSRKRIWCIEEDVGMLWFTPQQMVYWGDQECFSISREQLAQIERKSDAKSTTALTGTAHVILHVRLPDGSIRQMRLHTEGIRTIFGKRKASDELAAQINAWHQSPAPVS